MFHVKRLPLDPLIYMIAVAAIIGSALPAHGAGLEIANWAVKIVVALLFFFYGARLETHETLAGLKNWKLNLLILCFTFIIFPIIGLALHPLQWIFGAGIYSGILYLTLVPSTVQASIALTGIAGGNVPAAIVSATTSNILGVFLTPLLAAALMSTATGQMDINGSTFLAIIVQLLIPFVLGQLLHRWLKDFAARKATKVIDRGTIVIVVYTAFSEARNEGIWSSVELSQIISLLIFIIAFVGFMLWLTKFVGTRLRYPLEDIIVIQFCGTKKSLASGLPMAIVLFGSANLGLLILPLMLFHSTQLIMCSQVATRYARKKTHV
ncbi:MAG: bile acid:sodium symporter family protein [Corynebacterium sp.]|nr:bile acid:sodium symporter family protein [Corynebacterium sp.]